MLILPVTSYVEAFLRERHGCGPYYIGENPKHPLRIEFRSATAQAPKYLTVHTHGRIHLDIGDSRHLRQTYEKNRKVFDRGVFGLHLFWTAFVHEVLGAQRFLESNYRAEIASFQERYALNDESYQLENLERQFRREMVRLRDGEQPRHYGVSMSPQKFPFPLT